MTVRSIRLEIDANQIAHLILDTPERSMNVIDQAFLDDLHAHATTIRDDASIVGAIVRSAKSAFVAGADLTTMERNLDSMDQDSVEVAFEKFFSLSRTIREIERLQKPVVALIDGAAMGGGFELCLGCHRRIMSDNPRAVVGLPEVQVGLLPGGGGTQRLIRMLGITTALPWLLEGKSAGAEAALKAGLVDEVVPSSELISAATRWILSGPTVTKPWDEKGYRIPGGGPTDPRVAPAFVVGNAMILANTHGNIPAPLAIQSCVYEGAQLPFDRALRLEVKYLLDVSLNSPVSKSMIRTLFLSKTHAERGASRPPAPEASEVHKLGIIGAGMMGAGIAKAAARRGIAVKLMDQSVDRAKAACDQIRADFQRQVDRGRLAADAMDRAMRLIEPVGSHAELADRELVIEAVFEDLDLKQSLIKSLDAHLSPDCIIATNTSGLPIAKIASASAKPNRVIGLHFFSPADRMPLVEIIRGPETTDACLAHSLDFTLQLKKTPIVVRDSRGFFTSRFIGAFVDDAIGMVAEGVSPALIENCSRQVGMPVGPLAITDELSIELSIHAGEAHRKVYGEAYREGRSVPVLRTLFDQGRLGKKVGKGFYDYGDAGKQIWSGLAEIYPLKRQQPDPELLRKRILFVQIIEALKAAEEGVLTSAADGDLGAILGVGFPAYTGGPFCYVDALTPAAFAEACNRLADVFGEHLRPPAIVSEMVQRGQRFYGPTARGLS
ncbi:MAG: 3-hydroxyacyl-CoA dehydrogenase NAD-binding domain-containing protein [Burkholderiaceae bacterium]